MDWREKTNSDLEIALKTLEQEHQVLKDRMISTLDKLEKVEKDYSAIWKIINKRLKG